jgi:hypothetical protein
MKTSASSQFYFDDSEVKRLQHLTRRMQQLSNQAGALLRCCISIRNASQSQNVADSLEALARQIILIQKRRYQMLASATEPHYREFVIDFGVRCEACEGLPLMDEGDDLVVLSFSDACPTQPELESLLDLADRVEELLMSTFHLRSGSRRASLTRAFSVLKSALLKQRAMPRFRPNSLYPEPKFRVLCKRFECTRCGRPMKWEGAHQDPRYIRALRRSQARKAEQKSFSDQATYDKIEKEAE